MTTQSDRERLRALAGRYAEIFTSDEMNERREVWRLSNRLERRTVPFVIEDNGSFFKDLMPPLQCEGEEEKGVEQYLLRAISNYELIDDDRIFPPYFPVNWYITRPSMCPELKIERVPDSTGKMLGYETNRPLAELESGLKKLRRDEFKVDRQGTLDTVDRLSKLFGDLLPVQIINGLTYHAGAGMAQKAVNWMGMDNFYMAMIDQPDNVHRFFDFVATEGLDFMNWLIKENLILPNGREYICGSGSYGYTDELPRREVKEGEAYLPEDCWAFLEAQEAVGISNDMYAEFIHPYQKRVGQHYGLVYYGCCEPVHGHWETIKQFSNLRKITISPWCDQQIMADAVGKTVVLSRKPHPMKLCGPQFDAVDFTNHINEALTIGKDNFVELIFRDTNPLNGSMKERVAEACGILHGLVGR